MTVSTSTRSATFSGGQSALTFTFRTLVSNPEYIAVNVVALTGGTITALTYNVGYTVSVNSSGVGGTVTVSPSYGTNYQYVVYRSTGITQASAYSDYNPFPSSTVENNLDQLTMINQETSDNQNRTATIPIGSTITAVTLPAPVDGSILAWSGTGGTLINTAVVISPSSTVADYFSSSTVIGLSSSTGNIFHEKIGNTVFINFTITGTASGSTRSFTLPYASGPHSMNVRVAIGTDNGSNSPYVYGSLPSGGSSTLSFFTDNLTSGAWSTAGTTIIKGQFFYHVA